MAFEIRKVQLTRCYYEGCDRRAESKGLCNRHYERLRRNGTFELRVMFDNLAGRQFGKLVPTAIERKKPSIRWHCLCECGNTTVVAASNLKSGHTISCGCVRKERPNRKTHGMTRTATYRSWAAMRRRCSDEKYAEWHLYGGRGISVCDRWQTSFANFLDDMGARPEGMSLDRINPDGDYEPGNCRWATSHDQAINKRDSPYGGKTLAELCFEAGLSENTVRTRMSRQGMDLHQALTTPLKYTRRPNGQES